MGETQADVSLRWSSASPPNPPHCNSLWCTAIHYNPLWCTAIHCNPLWCAIVVLWRCTAINYYPQRCAAPHGNQMHFTVMQKKSQYSAQCSRCQLGCSGSQNFPCISGSCYRSILSEIRDWKSQYFSWLLKSEHVKTNIFGNCMTKLTI